MRDDFDDPPRRRPPPDTSTASGLKVVGVVLGVIAISGLCLVGAAVGLVAYLVHHGKKAFNQSFAQVEGQMRTMRVASALTAYEMKHGHFPPPSMPTKSGAPGLSWRVAILPELGLDHLYRQFRIDEAWNHPDNLRLASQMPDVFLPPGQNFGEVTHLRVFVGPGALFEFGKTKRVVEIKDGTSNTFTFIEAAQPVKWIEPNELPFKPGGVVPALGRPGQDRIVAGAADGRVHVFMRSYDAKRLEAAITIAGGEPGGLP